jgi:HEAT repeat protein
MLRKFVFTTVFAAVLAATTFTAGCKPGDPNKFETHVEKLSDPKLQTEAMQGIERIVSGIAANDDAERRKEFAEKVLPKFDEIWADSPQFRKQMLTMALQMKQPEAVPMWTKALELDGSAEGHEQAILALQGIRESKATEGAKPVIDALTKLKDNPGKDNAEGQPGALRYEMCKTLGELRSKEAVPLLIELLKQPEEQQPKAVYKAAAHALGQIGDPAAVSDLIAVQFRVADVASTTSIPEIAIQSIGAIGEAAVPKLVETIEGKNEEVNALAAEKGVEVVVVQQTALRVLGVVGSKQATAAMVAYMPQADCALETPPAPEDMQDDVLVRAFAANALGFVADPAAVKSLCDCRNTTHNPGDLWEIVSALGRIGGDEAFQCLKDVVTTNFYNPDAVASSDFKYQIRWEGMRWMIIAAPPAKAAEITAVLEGNDPKVKEEVEKLGWMKGAKVLEECKEDKGCYEKVLADSTRDWFEREVAAFNYARMSEPGDIAAAANLSKAFKTRDPEARINIAWLAGKVAGGKPCPECATALEDVMKAEELTKEPTMQGAWLTARQTIAKVSAGGGAAPAAEGK